MNKKQQTKVIVLKVNPQEDIIEIMNEIYDRLNRLGYNVSKDTRKEIEFTSIKESKISVDINLMFLDYKEGDL